MPPNASKCNFEKVILQMVSAGAFDDYAAPLGKKHAELEKHGITNPAYPGQSSYGNGPAQIERMEVDLPPDLIQAQHRSLKDAIRLYMPEKELGQWMHHYFSADFTQDPSFRRLMTSLQLPVKWQLGRQNNVLDDELTLKMGDPRRARHDRKLYTAKELQLTAEVCYQVPALALTVIAYQASHMAYLSALGTAIGESTHLTDAQRARGSEVVKELYDNWDGDNFVNNILPAVALHYLKNHLKRGEKPTESDFSEGMQFAIDKGMFRNTLMAPDGSNRDFICPAKGIVTRMSMPPEHAEPAAISRKGEGLPHESAVGKGLFHIFGAIDQAIESGKYSVWVAVGNVQQMAQQALVQIT